jgi:hypothetical protein
MLVEGKRPWQADEHLANPSVKDHYECLTETPKWRNARVLDNAPTRVFRSLQMRSEGNTAHTNQSEVK